VARREFAPDVPEFLEVDLCRAFCGFDAERGVAALTAAARHPPFELFGLRQSEERFGLLTVGITGRVIQANIEAFYGNCRFIFTCNYKNKIIEPLHSRCAVVEFGIKSKDRPKIASKFFERLKKILDQEKVEADDKVLVQLINKHFPDYRRVLNECQRYSVSGKIDSAILATFSDIKVNDLIKHLKEKNFPEVRKWIVANLDNDASSILRMVYDALYEHLDGPSIASCVLIVAKYQYQSAFVVDQEINLLAALTEIMIESNFK
jgi:DNA polymerase III delta prime subunit